MLERKTDKMWIRLVGQCVRPMHLSSIHSPYLMCKVLKECYINKESFIGLLNENYSMSLQISNLMQEGDWRTDFEIPYDKCI